MMHKQRGVTTIGWIFLLIPVALVVYSAIRVLPEYMNYYKVVQALEETATKLKSDETLSQAAIFGSIEKRFDTGYINTPAPREILIRKGPNGWEMEADYEATAPVFGNLHLLMSFKKTVVIN